MADSDNEDDNVTKVETKIERLKSENPKEALFSITFAKFEDLPSEKGDDVVSSEFSCFGTQWRLSIHPGGSRDSLDGMVALHLERRSEGRDLAIKYSLAVCSEDGRNISQQERSTLDGSDAGDRCGWRNFCPREQIIVSYKYNYGVYLVKGALFVHVGIQLDECIPKNPASSIMLKLFDDETSADVVFETRVQQKRSENSTSNDRKRTKTSVTKLHHAHRLILQHHSPELSALCATSDGNFPMTPIIINDVNPEVFRHLLYYVYGGEISEEEFVGHERELINAADKYGVTNLKLEAEIWCVKNTEITVDNVIDTLLYAHAMNCALLKEAVMDFIVENKKTILRKEQVSFQDVPGDVIKELLATMSYYHGEDSSSDDEDNEDENEPDAEKTYSTMRIRDLRQKLQDKGLDIDGSREALIAKLKDHS